MKKLPKGFVDLTGAYLVKAVPVHKVLLTPEQVTSRRNELLVNLDAAGDNPAIVKAISAELKKLERKRND